MNNKTNSKINKKRQLLTNILIRLTTKVLNKYKPIVIAITGNVGKTSTKEAVFTILKSKYRCRRNEMNYNTPIGVAITVIGTKSGEGSLIAWCLNILFAFKLLLFRQKDYPEILIIEMGADRPGDIEYLCNILKPKIGIITNIGDIPVHIEYFKNIEDLYYEKSKLIKCLPPEGAAILNYDNKKILDFKNLTNASVITYGFDEGAEVRASNFKIIPQNNLDESEMYFRIEHGGTSMPFQIAGVFGKNYAYAFLCAISVGIYFNINLVESLEYLKDYKKLPHRTNILPAIKNSWIIDDSYNASPVAVSFSLELLNTLPANRRIFVFGDMKELGSYTEQAHRQVGDEIIKYNIDLVINIGNYTENTYNQLINNGFKADNVYYFKNLLDAIDLLQNIIQTGDIILIKGSHSMGLDKIVQSLAKN